jgi:hypothetical protein
VRTRAVIAAAAAALVLALPASAPAAPDTGVNVTWLWPNIPSLVAPLGTHYVRVFMRWDQIETGNGVYDSSALAQSDVSIRSYAPGTKVDVDVYGTPKWANGGQGPTVPPSDPRYYAGFLHFVVSRYRGQVAGWEVWNEEDAPGFYGGDAAQYTAMLKAAYPAAKSADPSTTLLIGGLTGNDYHFLEQIYASGGAGSFDAVGVHTDTACNLVSPYSYFRDADGRIDQFSFLGYREVHAVMDSHGDGGKPIWMTEFGWSTTNSTCANGRWAGQKAAGVSESDQAVFLTQALHCVAGDSYVPVMIWFQLRDAGPGDTAEERFGLLRNNGTPKPAFSALQTFDAQGDTLTEPCGNFSGPQLSLVAPKPNLRYSGPLQITVAAHSTYGVPRITIYDDGKKIRNFTSKTKPAQLVGRIRWMGAKHLKRGRHVISALALDPMGNQTTTSVVVYRV